MTWQHELLRVDVVALVRTVCGLSRTPTTFKVESLSTRGPRAAITSSIIACVACHTQASLLCSHCHTSLIATAALHPCFLPRACLALGHHSFTHYNMRCSTTSLQMLHTETVEDCGRLWKLSTLGTRGNYHQKNPSQQPN